MKTLLRAVIAFALLAVPKCTFAQSASAPVAPVAVIPVKPHAPVVHPDGSVTFTFVEPNVADVKLSVDALGAPLAMTRGEDGAWAVTTPVLRPEIYSYHFNVDGQDFNDPASVWVTPSLLNHSNLLLVPGAAAGMPAQPWEHTDIAHGTLERHFYHSQIVGDNREYFVYTPSGYDAKAKRKYPVLYLLHGYSDNANGWSEVGQANFIFDNLIAAGKAQPMIVVMTLGYGDLDVLSQGHPFDRPGLIARNYANYTKSLLGEVMPQVEHEFRVESGPRHTAIVGLSMGGAEALYTGVGHPEKFGYVGAMSAAPVLFDDPAQGLQWKEKRELLWIRCGEQDPLVGDANQKLYAWLKGQSVVGDFGWTAGSHTWQVWRENLVAFAPLLFRAK